MELTIKLRRDSKSNWTLVNPILAEGEVGVELETKFFKIGDGITPWNSLEYASFDDSVIGNLSSLTTDAKNTLVAAINEVDSNLDTEITRATAVEQNLQNTKQDNITGAASTITTDNLTANKVAVTSGGGKISTSMVSTTELSYLLGATSNIQNQIGTLNSLTTDTKSNTVAAINEIDSHTDTNTSNIGTLNSLTTDAHTDLVSAINEVDANSDTNASNIGTLSSLSTDSKTNLVSAINEVDSHSNNNATNIGTLNNLTTDAKNNLVSAINEVDSQSDTNTSDISDIKSLIPNDASTTNQLADKNFVNSSVSTNTSNFIGTFNSIAERDAYAGTLTNNDYCFVIGTDTAGNTVYNRYKWSTNTTPASWIFEYSLNNSSFTAEQWAAVNSKATESKITQITTNQNAIGTLSSLSTDVKTNLVAAINEVDSHSDTNTSNIGTLSSLTTDNKTNLVNAVNEINANKQNNITSTNKLGSDLVDDTNQSHKFVTNAEKTQITTNQNAIGTLSSLTTTEKTNLVGAINEVKTTADSKVSDITIDGTSIVTNGVAEIPNASGSVTGVTRLSANLTSISNTIAATASMGNTLAKNIITGVDIYSSSSTYSVGDKVRYGQYYYECITAITTAHAWNASEWQEITIQSQIDEKVDDVTVDGTSIVNGTTKVAAIPLAAASGGYGLVKLSDANTGLTISNSGNLVVSAASNLNIEGKTNAYKPVVPANLDYATKRGIAYNSLTLTDAEKASACSFVGALSNNIYGESTTAAATVQKEVSIPSITSLNAGQLIIVKPTVTSTAANSTLKLNNFDAYPMLYGGNAITTATDSYVWIKDVPGWWLFDGSNWLFAGHGYDINTTYNSTTLALMIEGTNTTNRLIAPSILKDGTFGVVTAYASGDTITPADKYLYTSTADISALTVNAPDSPDERYVSQINFSSGMVATTLSYSNTFKVIEGCDDVQTINGVRVFVPVANKRYQMFILNDGVNNLIIAKGV